MLRIKGFNFFLSILHTTFLLLQGPLGNLLSQRATPSDKSLNGLIGVPILKVAEIGHQVYHARGHVTLALSHSLLPFTHCQSAYIGSNRQTIGAPFGRCQPRVLLTLVDQHLKWR